MLQTTLNDGGTTTVVADMELVGVEAAKVVIHGRTVHGKHSKF